MEANNKVKGGQGSGPKRVVGSQRGMQVVNDGTRQTNQVYQHLTGVVSNLNSASIQSSNAHGTNLSTGQNSKPNE